MDIQILVDFENIIKKYKVLKIDKVWEKYDANFKLIYNMEGIVIHDKFYPLIKLIFWLDHKKKNITENVITYMYTLSCDYKSITLTTIEETFNNIIKFIDNEKTNSELAEFIITSTDAFNKEIKAENVNNFIQNLNMITQGNIPCITMKFKFELTSNDSTYNFTLKPLKNNWELTYETKTEILSINAIPKKIIEWIYAIK